MRGRPVNMRVHGDGPPLLLLNGLTRPLESWEPFTAELGDRTIISFDAPGVGRSRTPLQLVSITKLAAIAASVLDAAGVASADVLGFSFGGAVAQQLAFDSPGRVRRLVIVSTTCGVGAIPSARPRLDSLRMPEDASTWP